MSSLSGSTISAILRHDSKVTSYKIALLRAINDVVLAFPDLASAEQAVAIPLRMLADHWIAYYWPFVAPQAPILQGPIAQRDGQTRQDMSFRGELAHLYAAWEQFIGSNPQPSDGYLLIADLRVERLREQYPVQVLDAYVSARRAIITALQMPIRGCFDRRPYRYGMPQDEERQRERLCGGALYKEEARWVHMYPSYGYNPI